MTPREKFDFIRDNQHLLEPPGDECGLCVVLAGIGLFVLMIGPFFLF